MKRHRCLVPLSDEHHRALVLARRLRRAAAQPAGADLPSLVEEVQRVFERELAPHFLVEERWLVPPLERAGCTAHVRQLRADHARVRHLVHGSGTWEEVAELGALLERHVRFEERELFPEAEVRLEPSELEAVRAASEGPESPPKGPGPAR